MSSPLHAVLVETLEARPEALAYLLELHGSPPAGPLIPTTGTRTKTFTLERRVDRAFLVGSRKAPQGFVLAEVQLEPDDERRSRSLGTRRHPMRSPWPTRRWT